MKSHGIRFGSVCLKVFTLVYLGGLVIVPLLYLLKQAFAPGWNVNFTESRDQYALAALVNTLLITFVTLCITIPFGIMTAFVLVRDRFPGRDLWNGVVDLPFAAPAAIGAFALLITYGPRGMLGPLLETAGFQIMFALPGMVLATVFVTLPFVIREVAPLLEEMGREAEEAARTLGASRAQTIFHITIPNLREGILYGAAQSYARALGEFGAVLAVSGNILGKTQTTPLYIYDAYIDFRMEAAYTAAALLVALSLGGMALLELWKRRWRA